MRHIGRKVDTSVPLCADFTSHKSKESRAKPCLSMITEPNTMPTRLLVAKVGKLQEKENDGGLEMSFIGSLENFLDYRNMSLLCPGLKKSSMWIRWQDGPERTISCCSMYRAAFFFF